jgi:thiamine transporter ThiT
MKRVIDCVVLIITLGQCTSQKKQTEHKGNEVNLYIQMILTLDLNSHRRYFFSYISQVVLFNFRETLSYILL